MSSTETGSGEKFLIVRVSHRFQKGPRPGERLGLSKPDEPKRDKTRLVWSSPKSMHRHFATLRRSAHSSSGLGHRPLTAAARVRIPYGPWLVSTETRSPDYSRNDEDGTDARASAPSSAQPLPGELWDDSEKVIRVSRADRVNARSRTALGHSGLCLSLHISTPVVRVLDPEGKA